MATRLPLYRMRDGQTRLGQSYFNPIWADLDSRLDTLERIKIDWNAQVAQLRELGLVRIDDYIRPLTDEVDQLLAQAKEETDGLAETLVDEHLLPLVTQANQLLTQAQDDTDGLAQQLVDEHIAPVLTQAQQLLGEIQGIKQSAQDDAAAIAQALAEMNWEQQLEDLEQSVNQAIGEKADKTSLDDLVQSVNQAIGEKRDKTDESFSSYSLSPNSLSATANSPIDVEGPRNLRQSIGGNRNYTFAGSPGNDAFTITLYIYSSSDLSNRTYSWPEEVEWLGGAPEFRGTKALIFFYWTGSEWLGSVGPQS